MRDRLPDPTTQYFIQLPLPQTSICLFILSPSIHSLIFSTIHHLFIHQCIHLIIDLSVHPFAPPTHPSIHAPSIYPFIREAERQMQLPSLSGPSLLYILILQTAKLTGIYYILWINKSVHTCAMMTLHDYNRLHIKGSPHNRVSKFSLYITHLFYSHDHGWWFHSAS